MTGKKQRPMGWGKWKISMMMLIMNDQFIGLDDKFVVSLGRPPNEMSDTPTMTTADKQTNKQTKRG